MEPYARELRKAVDADPDALFRVAREVVAGTPSFGPERYSDEELHQLLNGFRTLLAEAMEDGGSDTYGFFLETAVPSLVADGQTSESLVHAAAAFGALLSMHLIQAVAPERQEDARSWLARFFGRYVADVAAAARRAEDERG